MEAMLRQPQRERPAPAMVPERLRAFARDERGTMTPLVMVLFTSIILVTGIAVDLLRHESVRADLQASLDRGVLAAASRTQTVDAATVVSEYVGTRVLDATVTDLAVTSAGFGNARAVTADASFELGTMFLKLAGLDTLRVPAFAAARQAFTNLEVSLVLDISGTMRWSNRLVNLQPAANGFLTQMLAGGGAEYTTVNLIPYAGQVNPGPFMFDYIGGVRDHGYSSCPEFTAADFADGALPSAGSYAQVPNFHHWRTDWGWMDWGWCPSDQTAITYLSSDLPGLTQAIDTIRLHDGTGTYNAMKWALALLDPASQPAVSAMVGAGLVDLRYDGRPAAWNDAGTAKIIVLMTDGQITQQYRPDHPDDPRLATEEVKVYRHPYSQTLSRSTGLGYFYALCDLAKANGVEIFTISFEAPASAQTEMQNCASEPKANHYYSVEGLDIVVAFQNIAAEIGRLKLTQ